MKLTQKSSVLNQKNLHVDLGERSYKIIIREGLLSYSGEILEKLGMSKRIGIITNPTVGRLYSHTVLQSLKSSEFNPVQMMVPDGEIYKSLDTARDLYTKLLLNRFDRDSALIALGGGVIGDLTGFVASTYLRGIPFVQIPTTLEAQVDASVGGKVAVDLPQGKNLVGAFYQPKCVLIDPSVLKSLPVREISSGLSEVIKYGVIWDPKFFEYLEKNIKSVFDFDFSVITRIIHRSCEIKAEVVATDETEKGLRAILNFGHTVGHAIETITGYEAFRHGEGVSVGMVAESIIAKQMGMFDSKSIQRLIKLCKITGLPVNIPKLNTSKIIKIMHHDKKVKDNQIRMVLPSKLGKVILVDKIKLGLIEKTLYQMMKG